MPWTGISTVIFNGRTLGTHGGGYDPFTFDITEAIDVSPPAISRPPVPGSATSRDSGAGSWYGAGMTCSAIPAAGGLLARDVGADVEGGAEREGPCVAVRKTE